MINQETRDNTQAIRELSKDLQETREELIALREQVKPMIKMYYVIVACLATETLGLIFIIATR